MASIPTTPSEKRLDTYLFSHSSLSCESVFYDPHLDVNKLFQFSESQPAEAALHALLSFTDRHEALIDLTMHPDIDVNLRDGNGVPPVLYLDSTMAHNKFSRAALRILLEDLRTDVTMRLPHGVSFFHFITADGNLCAIELAMVLGRADHLPDGEELSENADYKEVKMLPDSLSKMMFVARHDMSVMYLWKRFLLDRKGTKAEIMGNLRQESQFIRG